MSFGELLFLFVLALLVFGPRKLPEIARQLGKAMAELRRASNEFRFSLEEEIRNADLQEQAKKADVTFTHSPAAILPPATPAESSAAESGEYGSAREYGGSSDYGVAGRDESWRTDYRALPPPAPSAASEHYSEAVAAPETAAAAAGADSAAPNPAAGIVAGNVAGIGGGAAPDLAAGAAAAPPAHSDSAAADGTAAGAKAAAAPPRAAAGRVPGTEPVSVDPWADPWSLPKRED